MKYRMWKDTPPAAEPKKLEKGEVRVRESTQQERADAEARAKYMKLLSAKPC